MLFGLPGKFCTVYGNREKKLEAWLSATGTVRSERYIHQVHNVHKAVGVQWVYMDLLASC